MTYLWFWRFWHWAAEQHRAGALLRGPVRGIAGHWDEWYGHEATAAERRAIARAGHTVRHQRRLVAWLARRWAREATWRGEHPPVRFVLAELARMPPFDGWAAFARYRNGAVAGGPAAVVLAEGSDGEAGDVRRVMAIVVPADDDTPPGLVAEGFAVDAASLAVARRALASLLRGRGLLRLLARWVLVGRRPYPRALGALLTLGWVAVAALVLHLALGPEPGDRLAVEAALLAAVWGALALVGVGTALALGVQAWRAGRAWEARLARGEVRLWMDGGLTVIGGSAGLPFCLGALLAVARAHPADGRRAWLWRRAVDALRRDGAAWAATGVVSADGRVGAVVLPPKTRACMRHDAVRHLLAPRQPEARARLLPRMLPRLLGVAPARGPSATAAAPRLGFAAEARPLRLHPCAHVADAVMTAGALRSPWQAAANALAVATSAAMLVALPDLHAIVRPPQAPLAVAPFSPSPYELWVSLDTPRPERFVVVLESGFWANRRAAVAPAGRAGVAPRAELRLRRLAYRATTRDVDDGTVWVERRPRFLGREFANGERVGRYSLSYVVGHP